MLKVWSGKAIIFGSLPRYAELAVIGGLDGHVPGKNFVEKDYLVSLKPAQWVVRGSTVRGSFSKTFRVREFRTEATEATSETRVVSLNQAVKVARLSEWRDCGWSPRGHAREAELTLEMELSEESSPKDTRVGLRFEHVVGPGKSERSAKVMLPVRRL